MRRVARLLSLLFAALCLALPRRGPPPRNLLLITLDTLRADHLGVYGYPRPTSPALDAFAARATVFEDATCSMPTTLPSHVSIFTGLRPAQHGVRRNGQVPERDLATVFDLLAARGAATAAVIGSRVMGERYLAGLGFDEVVFPSSERQYQARAKHVTNHAAAWIERHRAAPFALWVHYYDVHEPYAPAAGFARQFDRGYAGPLSGALDVETLVGFNDPAAAPLSAADLAHVTDLYDAEIAYLDTHLGRLFARLEALGGMDDTVVVVVGDHGQALGDNGFFGHGLRLLEPVVKVPFLLRLPGQTAGARVAAPVETVDLVPTLLELFALAPPGPLPGRSLLPVLAGKPLPVLPFRLVERRAYPEQPEVVGLALHGGDWKAVYYRDEDGEESTLLGRGAGELDGANLYEPGSQEARWLDAARARLAGAEVAAAAPDEEELRMLRALGYVD
ncbi:MAG: sulfatase [Acidobacteriota bacterium]|nr:sulfatase [Acidobacteriota bacterium]